MDKLAPLCWIFFFRSGKKILRENENQILILLKGSIKEKRDDLILILEGTTIQIPSSLYTDLRVNDYLDEVKEEDWFSQENDSVCLVASTDVHMLAL
jgi:hypothetical protein